MREMLSDHKKSEKVVNKYNERWGLLGSGGTAKLLVVKETPLLFERKGTPTTTMYSYMKSLPFTTTMYLYMKALPFGQKKGRQHDGWTLVIILSRPSRCNTNKYQGQGRGPLP